MAEEWKASVGRAIKERREALGLTQNDLAVRASYKEGQTVSRWENGRNLPGDLSAIAEALECTVADLVRGVEAPNARAARQLGIEVLADASEDDGPLATLARIESAIARQDKTLREIRKTLNAMQSGAARAISDFSARLDELTDQPDPGSSGTADPPPEAPAADG